jgi:hypothetical protein
MLTGSAEACVRSCASWQTSSPGPAVTSGPRIPGARSRQARGHGRARAGQRLRTRCRAAAPTAPPGR